MREWEENLWKDLVTSGINVGVFRALLENGHSVFKLVETQQQLVAENVLLGPHSSSGTPPSTFPQACYVISWSHIFLRKL